MHNEREGKAWNLDLRNPWDTGRRVWLSPGPEPKEYLFNATRYSIALRAANCLSQARDAAQRCDAVREPE